MPYVYGYFLSTGECFYVGAGTSPARKNDIKSRSAIFKRFLSLLSERGYTSEVRILRDNLTSIEVFKVESEYIKFYLDRGDRLLNNTKARHHSVSKTERDKHFRPAFRSAKHSEVRVQTLEERYGVYLARAPYDLRVQRARNLVIAGVGGMSPKEHKHGVMSPDARHDRWVIQFGNKYGIRALGIFDSLVIKHGPSPAAQYGSFTGLLMDIREATKEKRK